MSVTRREFIIGAAAGLILPSWFDRALAYYENTGEALLEVPRNAGIDMIACSELGIDSGFELNLGDPFEEPPEMTVRDYARRYFGNEENYLYMMELEDEDFDQKMDFWDYVDTWAYTDSPNARAYRFLESLDLGPQFSGQDAVGEIRFIDGASPASDYLGAHAPSELDIALLQKRLNDINAGVRILVQ